MKPFVPVILWAIIILILSTMPGVQLPTTIIATDKLGHFAIYGIFNWLAIKGLASSDNLTSKSVLIATLVVTSYGVLMELVQWGFFPNRFLEVWDMVANFIGAVLVYIIFNFHFTKK
ncbi:MAG: VanZ family protein [Saprospiraceae bacterium]|nr:VanZ family protein [Saprospiraceae bacterium]MCF8248342.1 VanZ family protein [Saprospiraceae bacterium]MCF8280219.1 VanZ family protein [Bacteroidales bacterium]MCF8309870.1 VanZ family protein [Saprospiraceae bacterium]MCF8438799.1 VanZ family protein [Saprospiraceae bacterium]